jgi:hypothetical protein
MVKDALATANAAAAMRKAQQERCPRLTNLNEDPQCCGVIMHFIPEGTTAIGSGKGSVPVEIVLSGLG